ncbi:MAG: glutamate--tRNA ligase [Ignavibacteriae bacterium]|nr:glutamate--tRNA ligase [Ignavibacteria bacterium]MBI3364930.1 glutamate--tRNA ligase [Ignavibacteriota bacterium]
MDTSTNNVRVRFAPSPTGYLHVGGLRTALYNYLFAQRHQGAFVLRIEDTDRSRYVEGAVENLIETLTWAGLEYDEGPLRDGPFGPYIQSERLEIYREHANNLVREGKAYRCFCSSDRLEAMRKEQEKQKLSPKYDRLCLRLPPQVIEENIQKGISFVVRMRVPDNEIIRFHDIIRDDVEFLSDRIDDQVLLKSDGYPTYHLANVIDDHLMQITHVIRGEEWLSSTPKHILLYRFFGWNTPMFAHLPLLLNPDRSKLSKRQGDVAVEEYRAKGYLKEALVNFVALLGWNPGDEREIFSLEELAKEFSLERVGKAGAIFNIDKLNWMNFEHLRRKSDQEVLAMLKEELAHSRFREHQLSDEYLFKVIAAMRVRVSFVKDYLEKSPYFFEAPTEFDHEVVRKRWKRDTPAHMEQLVKMFRKLNKPFPTKEDFEKALYETLGNLITASPDGGLIHPTRLAISGVGVGPGLFDMLYILGRDESIRRIITAIEKIRIE